MAFVLEGVVLPVSIAAHIMLFLVFRRFAPLKDTLLWFAAAGAASILTSTLLGITSVRLLLAPYLFEREAALTAAAAFKTGLEMLQQKGGVGQPSHVAPGGSVGH